MSSATYADVAQLVEQLSCKQQVIGSSPIVGFQTDDSLSKIGWKEIPVVLVVCVCSFQGGCPSGQWDLTVNQTAFAYGGSNPPPPTQAHIAQSVEHILGKNEVIGSSPIVGSSLGSPSSLGLLAVTQ